MTDFCPKAFGPDFYIAKILNYFNKLKLFLKILAQRTSGFCIGNLPRRKTPLLSASPPQVD
jgi:hypothetical protein